MAVSTNQHRTACGQNTLMASPVVKLLQQSLANINISTQTQNSDYSFIPVLADRGNSLAFVTACMTTGTCAMLVSK